MDKTSHNIVSFILSYMISYLRGIELFAIIWCLILFAFNNCFSICYFYYVRDESSGVNNFCKLYICKKDIIIFKINFD